MTRTVDDISGIVEACIFGALKSCASIASKYTDRSNLRLLCGELSPQEMRTAIAVANAIAREIEGLEKV